MIIIFFSSSLSFSVNQQNSTETPKPTLNCPRLNGYFGHKDKNVCDKFYYCVDGKYNMITCPAGLVFNPKTGICTWPDEAQKVGCSSEGEFIRYDLNSLQMHIFKNVINVAIGDFPSKFFGSQ